MGIIVSILAFLKVFIFVLSILYCFKMIYDTAKVLTLQEGKIELGEYGLLPLGCAIAYIISYIFV